MLIKISKRDKMKFNEAKRILNYYEDEVSGISFFFINLFYI